MLKEFFKTTLEGVGFSDIDIQKTPLGTRVTVKAARPGLVIGKKGSNVKALTEVLARDFKIENPQIDVEEIKNPELNGQIMADRLASALMRGEHYRRSGYGLLRRIMRSGAEGAEIVITGKLTSQRSRYQKMRAGIVKRCGEPVRSMSYGVAHAKLKAGIIGVRIAILPPNYDNPKEVTYYGRERLSPELKEKVSAEPVPAAAAEPKVEVLGKAEKPVTPDELELALEPITEIETEVEDVSVPLVEGDEAPKSVVKKAAAKKGKFKGEILDAEELEEDKDIVPAAAAKALQSVEVPLEEVAVKKVKPAKRGKAAKEPETPKEEASEDAPAKEAKPAKAAKPAKRGKAAKETEAPAIEAPAEAVKEPEAPKEEVTEAPKEEVAEAPKEEVVEAPKEEIAEKAAEAPKEEVVETPKEEASPEKKPRRGLFGRKKDNGE
jgi:small subunit ribosomal protein S3